MTDRYPGYDVLNKRDTPSWNAKTRAVVDARMAIDPDRHAFFSEPEWRTLCALCDRIIPQPPVTIILGLGAVFELPILVFFLSLMGVVTAGWTWRNLRYSILGIFTIAAILTPTTDILNMCVFAAPMVILYVISIGIAYMVHPKQRRARAAKKKK